LLLGELPRVETPEETRGEEFPEELKHVMTPQFTWQPLGSVVGGTVCWQLAGGGGQFRGWQGRLWEETEEGGTLLALPPPPHSVG
jgi:hypothetical protein